MAGPVWAAGSRGTERRTSMVSFSRVTEIVWGIVRLLAGILLGFLLILVLVGVLFGRGPIAQWLPKGSNIIAGGNTSVLPQAASTTDDPHSEGYSFQMDVHRVMSALEIPRERFVQWSASQNGAQVVGPATIYNHWIVDMGSGDDPSQFIAQGNWRFIGDNGTTKRFQMMSDGQLAKGQKATIYPFGTGIVPLP